MEKLVDMGSTANLMFNTTSATEMKSLTAFQWEGTLSAIFLLIVNWAGRRSALRTSLLVLYLLTSFPESLFKILRGEFGCWIAFLAVAANLYFPQTFPVSRFILFVVTPEWVANGLRNGIGGVIFGLVLAVLLLLAELLQIGVFRNFECGFSCFFYFLGISFLFFFTILHLSN
ncbi:cold-regulated 413 plasma membrane protein 4-like [Euphorbia lathyris]|uniref:cold-regulated 413 plasma membrane protein 4-like n=1 Tax=Euphorbia lathyris TaxID=212925 RepID=UPI0033133380